MEKGYEADQQRLNSAELQFSLWEVCLGTAVTGVCDIDSVPPLVVLLR